MKNEEKHEASVPLMAAVAAVVRATEDLDARLKARFPLKIERDKRSVQDLDEIVKEVIAETNEKDAHEIVARLTRDYSTLCGELQEALKAPSITKAKTSGIAGPIGKKMSNEDMKELRGLAIAGVILLGATVLGNVLTRQRK